MRYILIFIVILFGLTHPGHASNKIRNIAEEALKKSAKPLTWKTSLNNWKNIGKNKIINSIKSGDLSDIPFKKGKKLIYKGVKNRIKKNPLLAGISSNVDQSLNAKIEEKVTAILNKKANSQHITPEIAQALKEVPQLNLPEDLKKIKNEKTYSLLNITIYRGILPKDHPIKIQKSKSMRAFVAGMLTLGVGLSLIHYHETWVDLFNAITQFSHKCLFPIGKSEAQPPLLPFDDPSVSISRCTDE